MTSHSKKLFHASSEYASLSYRFNSLSLSYSYTRRGRSTDPKSQQELQLWKQRCAKQVIRPGGKRWRKKKEDNDEGDDTERKCGEEAQREGIKHGEKQFRRQLSVSRAKIAGQFPPLRACANLFLLRFCRLVRPPLFSRFSR